MEVLGFGPITIDFTPLLALADNPISAAWFLIANGGWIIFLSFFLWMARALWYDTIQTQFKAKHLRPVLLAIDVPKQSSEVQSQTPKAVENIFAHLAGAHGTANRREKHLEGKIQEWFSLEIVSIDGYVQFLVWTWDKYRDLVETAIYAQYADAQITEVQDYATAVPQRYPDGEWDAWGTEFIFVKHWAYPLRTYEAFEHKGVKDESFKDPLAAMLENFSRVGPGEQIWFQILAEPIGQDWQKEAAKLVRKLIGAKEPKKATLIDHVFAVVGFIIGPIYQQIFGVDGEVAAPKREDPPSKILYISPGERLAVEAVEKKMAKIGFKVKIRLFYVARKEAFQKAHGAHAVIGAIKQFNTNDLNSLKPEFKRIGPSSLWLFKKRRNSWRKTKLVRAYRQRSMWVGAPKMILNIEELASLWHFPTEAVHAPLIMRTDAKRGVAPAGLPMDRPIPAAAPVPQPPSTPQPSAPPRPPEHPHRPLSPSGGGGGAKGVPPEGLPLV